LEAGQRRGAALPVVSPALQLGRRSCALLGAAVEQLALQFRRSGRRQADRSKRERRRHADRIRRRGSQNPRDFRGVSQASGSALPHGLHGSVVHAEGSGVSLSESFSVTGRIGMTVKDLRVSRTLRIAAMTTVLGFTFPAAAADWESTLAAAKKEGKVAVLTDITAAMRDALTLEFQKKYGIPVELMGVSGREVAPRVTAERKAGQFLWDVYVHGSTTALEAMIPMGAFDPLEPALILADVKEAKTCRAGAR